MGMVVNNNIPALFSFNAVTKTGNSLQKSIQKLSTGLRINSAADDAAGLAISEKMRAQIRGLDRAVSNSQDGISMIQTAEGALNETHSILQRMRELSVQSANDTLTQQDRGYIQLEIDQLREEITRIGNTTQFNKKKLLDGSAAVLWSSDNLNTKAIVNGGLRQVDQFGQKKAIEGNYKIDIKAEAGQGEIKKSDIFKVKHKDVISVSSKAAFISEITGKNLTAGEDYTVTGAANSAVATAVVAKKGQWDDGFIKGAFVNAGNAQLLVEVIGKSDAGTGKEASLTLRLTSIVTGLDGQSKTQTGTLTVKTKADGTAPADDIELNTVLTGFAGTAVVDKSKLLQTALTKINVGDKIIYQSSPDDGDVQLQVAGPGATPAAKYNLTAADAAVGKTLTLRHFEIDAKTGESKIADVSLKFDATKPDGSAVGADDLKAALATFKAYKVGDVARGDVKLRDLDKFWDAQGRFMLTDPQTITITQGDGKQAKVTLYANDTLNDVADKLNKAIGRKVEDGGLGQGEYVDSLDHFVSFVNEKTATNTSESVAGTFVIRSVVPGATGRLNFAGDEDLIKAFSLNVIQDAKESNYTVDITDAHTGKSVVSGVTTTGNRLIGVLHSNIDVEFDAMTGIRSKWDEASKSYIFDSEAVKKLKDAGKMSTILHLADNTTVFQIGANEGEDMGINIGDMRAHALGLNAVLVTDRASAARSITIIDNALDKVSTQRAKLGAYQNRLEHTINNLTVAGENLTSAESRIRDTDMAKEMMNFTKLNIMLQAGNAMLAQANQLPQGVLSLIR